MRSKFLNLNSRDFIKGLIVVVICTFITGFYQLVANGGALTWLTLKPVVIAVLGAAVSYLTKNLLTNSHGDFMRGETDPQNSSCFLTTHPPFLPSRCRYGEAR